MKSKEYIPSGEMEMLSFFDELVMSQYTQEQTYEENIVPRKYTEARKARADKFYKALALFYFFCLWELVSYLNAQSGWFNPVFLPSPVTVIETGYAYLMSGALAMHIGMSFYRMLAGFVLGGPPRWWLAS